MPSILVLTRQTTSPVQFWIHAIVSNLKLKKKDMSIYFNSHTSQPSHSFTVILEANLNCNIRSLAKNINRLEDLLCSLGVQPDVIGITETRLNLKKLRQY